MAQLSSFSFMLRYELLALQGFKCTAPYIQLSLVNFMEYVLSEDMIKNTIQWEYSASKEIQHSKSITNLRQMCFVHDYGCNQKCNVGGFS